MAEDVHLNVLLPKNRNHTGWLRVEVNGFPKAEFRVLGRGSTRVKNKPTGNPARNPFLFAGDTPTGDYVSPGLADTGDWDPDSYGPWGAVRLRAVAGDALLAERLGRNLLLIHGGAAGTFEGYRSTMGCLRLSNSDMLDLRTLLFSATEDPRAQMCRDVSVRVSVREW
jgi:hypothetical protein